MKVAVLIPWVAGCTHRERAFSWVRGWWHDNFPDWELIPGTPQEGLSRSQSLRDAAQRTDAGILICADADVWCDPAGITKAVNEVRKSGWAIPHLMIHRLSESSTDLFYQGWDWSSLELSQDNEQDSQPYVGFETGTMLVITHEVFDRVGPDPRLVEWGQEDECWSMALRTLQGPPWRGQVPLIHLWHPPQPRLNRRYGSEYNRQIYGLYKMASGSPSMMKEVMNGHSLQEELPGH